ncbi:Repeat domain-containing protein [Desulfonauticus submarinus]|uniref:Repeat domain-containing protein n=2 Tax=Desulfonauticus submarinus TaxID=206665 RepID=A0A1H0BE95_9BACT|nr:Repeat domain-containing protein [Desulfonauticus submarinus]
MQANYLCQKGIYKNFQGALNTMLKKISLALILLFFITTLNATASNPKTFLVLPFKILGPQKYLYLAQGAKTMLTTRLSWPNHLEPKEDSINKQPKNKQDAIKLAQQIGVDYLVYGTITIMGNQCSLDIQTVSANKSFPQSIQTTLDNLIPALEKVAKTINNQVFNRPKQQQASSQPKQTKGPINSEFVYNETSPKSSFYLNPEFKFAGNANNPNKWRSQSLPFASVGMVAGDANQDGKTEIFILEHQKIHAYRLVKGLLKPLATYKTPPSYQCLNINIADLNRDGFQEIIVSAKQDNFIRSFILEFKENKFQILQNKIPFFLNIVRTPPEFQKTLIGQSFGHGRLFDPDSVYELIKIKGKYQKLRKLSLPPYATVFNFTYLPQEKDYKIIVNHNDHLYIYTPTNSLLAKTEEIYAATSIGFPYYETMSGLGTPKDIDPNMYYISGRLLPVNLDQDNKFELIVSRPISLSSQFFSRYRNFPQGEIHCLFWDGIGLNLLWKTRRIKGTIVDYGLYDLNGDNKKELVVCVNSHPGATGLKHKKTIILSYTLQSTQKK